jgi:hypothetical protein
VTNGHVNREAVFAIERFAAYVACVDKLAREMYRFHMVFYIGLVLICFATAPTLKQACVRIFHDIFVEHYPIS